MNRKIKDKERADKGKHLSAFLTHKKRSIAVITAAVLTVSTIAAGIPSLAGEADAAQKTEPKTASQTVDAKTAVQKEDGALDLRDYITDVDVRVEENGKWVESDTVEPGQKASFDVSYTIPGNTIDDVRKLVYDIDDEHLDIDTEQSGKVTETAPEEAASRDAEEKQENKGTYKVDTDDSVTIDLNKDTDISKEQKGSFNIEGTVKNVEDTEDAADVAKSGKAEKSEKAEAPDESEIVFNDDVTVPVTEPEQSKEAADSGKAAETQTADKQDDVENTEKTDSTDSTAADSKVEDKDSSQAVPESGDAAEAEKKVEDQNPDAQQAENAGEPEKADQEAEEKDASLTDKIIDKVKGGIDVFKTNPVISFRDADAGYSVQLIYNENSGIKERTTLSVKEITDKADHEKYLNRSREGIEVKDGHRLEGRFFDISLLDKDGNEYEPEGPVDVRIIYDKKIEKAKGGFKAVHFAKPEKAGAEDVDLEDTSLELPEITGTDPEDRSVQFETESFSVYGVVYTVDYTLGDYTYSMPGGSSMKLSELMTQLGVKDFDLSKVKDVTFDDETLVKVKKAGDDWTLTSLKPFNTLQKLTIEMTDGSKIEVGVTDDIDLESYITGFSSYKGTIEQNGETTWKESKEFNDGDSAKFTINYSIGKDALKPGDSLTYNLGENITLPGNGESGDVKQGDTVVGRYTITKDGKVTITLNDQFESTEAFTGDLTFEGTVKNDSTENKATVNFGVAGSVTINPKLKNTDLQISKTAQKQTDGTIKYKILVTTEKGTNGQIDLYDWLSGFGFSQDQISGWSVKYKGSNIAPDNSDLSIVTPTYDSKGWHLILPGIPSTSFGQYEIEYILNPSNIQSDADGKEVIKNTAQASDSSQTKQTTTETIYRKSFVQKSVSADWNNRKLKWTITVVNNDPKNHNLNEDIFKDVMTVDGQEVQLPSTVTITDDGNTWEVPVGADGKINFPKWQYNTTYTITYETDMPDGPKNKTSDVKNTITYEHDGKTYTSTAEQTGISGTQNIYDVDKSCEETKDNYASNSYDVRWCSTITLPKGTLDKSKILYTDTLTTINKDDNSTISGQHYTTAKQLNEMFVWWWDGTTTGNLTKGTDYRILDADGKDITNTTDETPLYGFKVEFTDTGIVALNGKKDVYIRYHSTATYGDQSEGTTWVFHNTGAIPDHSKDVSTEHYKQRIIDKMSSSTGPATVMKDGIRNYNDSGVSVDKKTGIIYYRVVVAIPQGTTGDIDLIDTIDPGLSYYNLDKMEIHGYGNDNHIYDDNEATNLKVNPGKPETNSDGSTSVHFTVTNYTAGKSFVLYYQAKVEDEDFWNNSKNYKKDYSNKISWKTHTDDTKTTVEKEQKILDKTAQQEIKEDDKYASYNIVVNPSGRDLDPLHNTLNLTDTISGGNTDTEYYLDVPSIKVYHYNPDNKPSYRGIEVSDSLYTYKYDEQSKNLTLTIPDEFACVVAYRYHVNPGVNDATLKNSAELSGVSNSNTSASTKIEASSSGANVYQYLMNIYKVDSDDYTIRLKGVTFELEKYVGVVWDSSKNTNIATWEKVKDITTDINGLARLNIKGDGLSQNTLYRITETSLGNNSNYQMKSAPYYFVWKGTVNGESNPTNDKVWGDGIKGTYLLGDDIKKQTIFLKDSGSIYVPNENTAVTVNKVWLDSEKNEIADTDKTATVRLYRQTATPDGFKVTININNNGAAASKKTIYVKRGSELSIRLRKLASATYDGNKVDGGYGDWDNTSKDTVVNFDLGTITENKDITIDGIFWNPPTDSDYQLFYTSADSYVYGEKQYVNASGNAVSNASDANVTLNSNDDYSHTWINLAKDDGNGTSYYYHVEEDPISGFETTYSDNNAEGIQHGVLTVTNTKKEKSGTVLPSAGGKGIIALLLTGGALAAGSAAYLLFRRRRRPSEK